MLLFLAVAGISLMAAPLHIMQNGGTVTPTPDRQTQLQNYLQNKGFSLVTPFTKTTVNGRDVYTGAALKTGVRYNVQYTFTNTTREATSLREQKIAEYKAEGYTSTGSDATSSSYDLWSGVSGDQVVSVGSNLGGNGLGAFVVVVKAVEA